MKQELGNPIFRDVPDRFVSPFPDADSLAAGKFQALIEQNGGKSLATGDFVRWGAKAFTDALQITEMNRAVYIGDLLGVDLNNSKFASYAVNGAVRGLFAAVAYPSTDKVVDLIRAAEDVGFSIAMGVLSKIPVYGQIAAGVLSAGRKLGKVFEQYQATKNPPPTLPWAKYSKGLDQDLVQLFLDREAQGVDYTPLFLPCFDDEPWQFGYKSDAKDGLVFGPVRGNSLAWNSSYGCLPNTARVFGQTQAELNFPAGPGGDGSSPLRRRAEAPPGMGIKDPIIFWALDVTFCGDWLSSLGQLGLAIWQQCLKPGPEMFRIDCALLQQRWQQCSANLFETGFASLDGVVGQLGASAGGIAAPYIKVLASQLLEPYVAVLRSKMPWANITAAETWNLGLFPNCPRPTPIVHPGIFKEGPVPKNQRSDAGWFEQDLPRKAWGWPYKTQPEQDWRRLATWTGYGAPDGGRLQGLDATNPTKGFRATPWPFPEVAKAGYSELYAIVYPAIVQLGTAQQKVLRRIFDADIAAGKFDPDILICAYVRPDPVDDLPRYGAFKTGGFRQLCRDAREKLVDLIIANHPARRRIDLRDVNAVDPKFAKRLRALGVPAEPPPFRETLGDRKPPMAIDEPGLRPQGGIPFEEELPLRPTSSGGGGGAALAAVGAALGIAAFVGLRR
jgi:hypothetical protein